jgi:hypothetical protein
MIPGHPHTVRSSDVPLYMRGWTLGLGDDPTMYDPSGGLIDPTAPSSSSGAFDLLPSIPAVTPIDTSMYDPTAGLTAPISNLSSQDQALAQLYQSSVAAGTMTAAQASSAIAQLITSGASAAKGLTTAPSPRVAVPAVPGAANSLMAATVIPGVPNIVLLLAAAGAAFAMGSR